MHVDSDPRDGSDPEAVSGSSTKNELRLIKMGLFLMFLLHIVVKITTQCKKYQTEKKQLKRCKKYNKKTAKTYCIFNELMLH